VWMVRLELYEAAVAIGMVPVCVGEIAWTAYSGIVCRVFATGTNVWRIAHECHWPGIRSTHSVV
jgi:hypothetical protein